MSKGESKEQISDQSSGTESAVALAEDAGIVAAVADATDEGTAQVNNRIAPFADHSIWYWPKNGECSAVWKVTAGQAERNGSLPPCL